MGLDDEMKQLFNYDTMAPGMKANVDQNTAFALHVLGNLLERIKSHQNGHGGDECEKHIWCTGIPAIEILAALTHEQTLLVLSAALKMLAPVVELIPADPNDFERPAGYEIFMGSDDVT